MLSSPDIKLLEPTKASFDPPFTEVGTFLSVSSVNYSQ